MNVHDTRLYTKDGEYLVCEVIRVTGRAEKTYHLEDLNSHEIILLKEEDHDIWKNYVHDNPAEARQSVREYYRHLIRKFEEQTVGVMSKEQLLTTLFDAWFSIFIGPLSEFNKPIMRKAGEEIVAERLLEYFGVDVTKRDG